MPALTVGSSAPEIQLQTTTGERFSLAQASKSGPVVAAFFKASCPVCQYAFPYLERIFKAYGDTKVKLYGVSQDPKTETEAFAREYGVTFPILLDDTKTYPASNAYGLTNVPSIFLVAPAGKVKLSSVGWSKAEMEDLNRFVAEQNGVAPKPLFQPGEKVSDFRPG